MAALVVTVMSPRGERCLTKKVTGQPRHFCRGFFGVIDRLGLQVERQWDRWHKPAAGQHRHFWRCCQGYGVQGAAARIASAHDRSVCIDVGIGAATAWSIQQLVVCAASPEVRLSRRSATSCAACNSVILQKPTANMSATASRQRWVGSLASLAKYSSRVVTLAASLGASDLVPTPSLAKVGKSRDLSRQ